METDIQYRSNSSRQIMLCIFALILLTRLALMLWSNANLFPINSLKIKSSYKFISRDQLQQILYPFMNQSFLSLSSQELAQAIRQNSWVDQVEVKKVWPDRVDIMVSERFPVAHWQDMLLTKQGVLFQPQQAQQIQTLPYFYGPKNQQLDVLHIYQKLSKLLKGQDLYIAAIRLRENQSWDLTLTNGVKIELGKNDIETRLNRFSNFYQKLFAAKFDQVSTVDLRYSKGMAVKWRKLDGQINNNTKT